MRSMESYSKAAVERAMKLQEVILRAMAKKLRPWQRLSLNRPGYLPSNPKAQRQRQRRRNPSGVRDIPSVVQIFDAPNPS